MDTRSKIISVPEAQTSLADGNWLVIAGYFDPLTLSVAQRFHSLVEHGRQERVLAVVLTGTDPLLSIEDRSNLTAALREVDAVLAMSESELEEFLASVPGIRFVFDEHEERRNTEAFTAALLAKQPGSVPLSEKHA